MVWWKCVSLPLRFSYLYITDASTRKISQKWPEAMPVLLEQYPWFTPSSRQTWPLFGLQDLGRFWILVLCELVNHSAAQPPVSKQNFSASFFPVAKAKRKSQQNFPQAIYWHFLLNTHSLTLRFTRVQPPPFKKTYATCIFPSFFASFPPPKPKLVASPKPAPPKSPRPPLGQLRRFGGLVWGWRKEDEQQQQQQQSLVSKETQRDLQRVQNFRMKSPISIWGALSRGWLVLDCKPWFRTLLKVSGFLVRV